MSLCQFLLTRSLEFSTLQSRMRLFINLQYMKCPYGLGSGRVSIPYWLLFLFLSSHGLEEARMTDKLWSFALMVADCLFADIYICVLFRF